MKKTGGGEREKSEELRHSLDTSGLLIRREYDLGYDRLGRRFAIGDRKSSCLLSMPREARGTDQGLTDMRGANI